MLKFALFGNPNSGKTTLFNSLTGSTAHVGNWPGVTVDKREGLYKEGGDSITIVDLPGIYSLSPYSPEEVIARNYILDEKPDCVINIVDATNLERNLYLTTQIMEIDVPVVIALNMMDVVERRGDSIDVKKLEERLGLPVVKISALRNVGLKKLMKRSMEACLTPRKGQTVLRESKLNGLISDCTLALKEQKVDNPVFHAIKLCEMDDLEVVMHKDTVGMVEDFKKSNPDASYDGDFEALIADERYKYITKHFSPTLKKKNEDKFVVTPSDKADKLLTHRIWSIPIFLLILFSIFHLTFSENFLFLKGIINDEWVSLSGTAFEGVFGSGAINSPGVALMGIVEVLASFVSDLIASILPEGSWVTGLVVDGVLGGIFAILGFLPQILVLFVLFSILEDTGYMARIAFILDRILRKFGLSGRAFLPMIMGFGCSVPAMINTRTLADEKERIATIRVIPFFSCGAKLPILTAIAGGIVRYFNVGNVDLITYGMYVLGIVTALVSVIIMRGTTLRGGTPPFIMELPAYHMPQFKNLMLLIWDKAKHFIKKAFTIILASTIVIWFITHFDFRFNFLSDEMIDSSILAKVGQFIQPLFTPLGFGSQLKGNFGWVFIVAVICGLIAKENVVATLGTLATCIVGGLIDVEADGGVLAVVSMIQNTGITIPALLSFIAFNMTTIPCFASVATARGELSSKKTFMFTILFWIVTSYIVSTAIYTILTWWWTLFIWLAIAVGVSIVLRIRNNKLIGG